jgi:hypothetical protein
VRRWLRHCHNSTLAVFRAVAQLWIVRPHERTMTRRPHFAWIVAACFLAGILILSYLVSNHSGQHSSVTFGDTTIDTALIGFFAVKIILIISAIAFIIQGFRVHWGWGLANLFLFPLAGIALFITHRREATYPMIIWSFGMALLVILLISLSI